MKMSDMRRTKAEQKAHSTRFDGPVEPDDYDHGLHVSLDHDGMNKVGMKETPKAGDEYRIEAHGRVVSTSDNSRAGQTTPDRRVTILIHRMGAEPKSAADDGKSVKDDVRDAASKWEGSKADNRIDRREAAKRGTTAAKFEGSAADNRIDAKARASMK